MGEKKIKTNQQTLPAKDKGDIKGFITARTCKLKIKFPRLKQ